MPQVRPVANLITGQTHHYGLGEAVPSRGGLPHEQLPWFPPLAQSMADNEMHPVRASWAEFQHRPLEFEFLASELTLLIHDGRY
ncbi:hypothetical protein [Moorena producens]|uniref:hypothetical protein n=1 Tax=Moorena producens TaxID=1155739 RepID=UPI003C732F29